MKKNYWIICFFILWLALGLSTIPASWAIYIAQKMLPNWQVDNVSGNFWQGSAQKSQLLIDNKPLAFGQLEWRLNPFGLLWLNPCVKFTTQLQDQILSANACLSLLSGKLQLQNSQFTFDVAVLQPWLLVHLKGDVHIVVESIVVKDEYFYDIEGIATWRQAQFHNSRTWINLGGLQARLMDDDTGGLRGHLTDTNQGVLMANLIIETSKESGLWVSGNITPQSTAQSTIHETLQIIGKPDNQGNYTIDWRDR